MTVRLLDVEDAAAYLSVSTSFLRALVGNGDLTPVRLPSTRGTGVNRRLLFDVRDLDALIDKWKTQSTGTPNPQLSQASIKGWRQTPIRKRGAA